MKYSLVTGGSRGIGKAVCLKLAEMGYYVLVNYCSNETEAINTLEMLREAGSDGELLKFDVADRVQVSEVLGKWHEEHGNATIEILVNNAGIRKDNLLVFMNDEELDSVLETNLGSFFNVTRMVIKNMLLKKYGRIINIVSLSGLKGMPGQTNYSAAKGGVIAATKALAQEVGKKKITVNCVAPGFIKTDMIADLNESDFKTIIPLGRFGTAGEVAELVGFLASDKASYITGQVISVNGGLF